MTELLVLVMFELVMAVWLRVVPTVVVTVRRLHMGASGLALPGVVFIREGAGEHVLRHELAHQDQLRRYGVVGTLIRLGGHYLLGLGRALRATKKVPAFFTLWARHPLELEANAAMCRGGPLPRHVHVDEIRRRRD